MLTGEKIKNSNELEFAVFCIENVAIKLNVNAERVYQAFTEKSDILNGYIVPEYEILHLHYVIWTILFVDSCMWIYSQYAGGFSVYVSSG